MKITVECCNCGRKFNQTIFMRSSTNIVILIDSYGCGCRKKYLPEDEPTDKPQTTGEQYEQTNRP